MNEKISFSTETETQTGTKIIKIDQDYCRFGDLSKINSKTLKNILSGYKGVLSISKNTENTKDVAAEIVSRIEGELLNRKDVVIKDGLFPEGNEENEGDEVGYEIDESLFSKN